MQPRDQVWTNGECPLLISLMAGIFLLSLTPVPGNAQEQDVSFIHGYQGDRSSWSSTATLLEREYAIDPTNKEYESWLSIPDAIVPNYAPKLPDNSVAVAHSMGGIVGREVFRQRPGKIRSLITIGTPHGGAQIATTASKVPELVTQNWLPEMAAPLRFLGLGDVDVLKDISLSDVASVTVNKLVRGGLELVSLYATSAPSVAEIAPLSPYLRNLNAAPGQTVPQNTYTIFSEEKGLAFWRLADTALNGGDESETGARLVQVITYIYLASAVTATIVSAYYSYKAQTACDGSGTLRTTPSFSSPISCGLRETQYRNRALYLQRYARVAFKAVADIVTQDLEWRNKILKANPVPGCGVIASDAFISCASQKAAPGSRNLRVERGVNHLEQRQDPRAINQVEKALLQVGVNRR